MLNHSLEPIPLKLIDEIPEFRAKSPFPYRDFSPAAGREARSATSGQQA